MGGIIHTHSQYHVRRQSDNFFIRFFSRQIQNIRFRLQRITEDGTFTDANNELYKGFSFSSGNFQRFNPSLVNRDTKIIDGGDVISFYRLLIDYQRDNEDYLSECGEVSNYVFDDTDNKVLSSTLLYYEGSNVSFYQGAYSSSIIFNRSGVYRYYFLNINDNIFERRDEDTYTLIKNSSTIYLSYEHMISNNLFIKEADGSYVQVPIQEGIIPVSLSIEIPINVIDEPRVLYVYSIDTIGNISIDSDASRLTIPSRVIRNTLPLLEGNLNIDNDIIPIISKRSGFPNSLQFTSSIEVSANNFNGTARIFMYLASANERPPSVNELVYSHMNFDVSIAGSKSIRLQGLEASSSYTLYLLYRLTTIQDVIVYSPIHSETLETGSMPTSQDITITSVDKLENSITEISINALGSGRLYYSVIPINAEHTPNDIRNTSGQLGGSIQITIGSRYTLRFRNLNEKYKLVWALFKESSAGANEITFTKSYNVLIK